MSDRGLGQRGGKHDWQNHKTCDCGQRGCFSYHRVLIESRPPMSKALRPTKGLPMSDRVRYLIWRIRQRLETSHCRGCADQGFHTHHLTWLGRKRWTR